MSSRSDKQDSAPAPREPAADGRSLEDAAGSAIAADVADRPQRLDGAVTRVLAEDAELLDRLAR